MRAWISAWVVAACGGDHVAPPDASTDAEADAQQRSPVTVHADNKSGPAANIHVVVNDPAGAIVSSIVTGADGNAVAIVPPGGSISAFTSTASDLYLTGAVDPPPGATLTVFDGDANPTTFPPIGTGYNVQFGAVPANTAKIYYSTPCGSSSSNGPFTGSYIVSDYMCPTPGYEAALVAVSAAGFVMGEARAHVASNPGTQVGPVAVTWSTDSWYSFATVDHLPVNVALPVASVTFDVAGRYVAHHAPAIEPFIASVSSTITSPTLMHQFSVPDADFYQADVHAEYSDLMHFNSSIDGYWITPTREINPTYDVGTLVNASLGVPDFTDPARPKLAWVANNAARGEGGVITILSHSGTLHVTATYDIPPDTRLVFQMPELPAELASYRPSIVDAASLDYWEAQDSTGTFDYQHLIEHAPYLVDEPGPAHYLWTRSLWYP